MTERVFVIMGLFTSFLLGYAGMSLLQWIAPNKVQIVSALIGGMWLMGLIILLVCAEMEE